MDPRIVVTAGIALVVLFVLLGVVDVLPWQAAGTLTATVIGVVGMILAVERRETMRPQKAPSLETLKPREEGRLLWEETILVSKNGCSYYQLKIAPNEKVTGEISSKDYFNVYFLTPRNYAKRGNGEDFAYEYGSEHASRMKVDFVPKNPGKHYIVIEGHGQTDIDVTVVLRFKNVQMQSEP